MTNPTKTDWSLSSGHGYILQRTNSHLSSCRLNLQHYLWKDTLKFSICPSVALNLPPKPLIADIATGTGAWLLDVARDLPNAQLHGFDNDLDQAPHKSWLPFNVDIKYWNIFDEIPDEMVGKYDLVHVRLLVLVIDGRFQAQSFVQKVMKMLKPGGYIQWDELDCVDMTVKKVSPEIQAPALEKLREKSWADGRYDWTVQIPYVLKEEGFENVKGHVYGDEAGLTRAFNEQHLLTMDEFARSLARLGKVEAAEAFWCLIEEGEKEAVEGAALCIPRIVSTGKKPMCVSYEQNPGRG
ncbi:UMTA methyltransferase family protein [Rutstroemia sp. NJR-2017a BVV2]|nr:UMTA methyltransferase family protein [Rutstroemia sp. NJR-2017a BVV2]